ncbi:hypothetical protein DPMN_062921 [Dreissena polymorpha]|uniref:Uncharacterized protein n=1 Tax=Dreissena polymorpha TaxID=45954 RepID=A0A9D4CAJ8_DREPO|nr:hypothetical protein DPMN_062921 [Dreissena polymorpha]
MVDHRQRLSLQRARDVEEASVSLTTERADCRDETFELSKDNRIRWQSGASWYVSISKTKVCLKNTQEMSRKLGTYASIIKGMNVSISTGSKTTQGVRYMDK